MLLTVNLQSSSLDLPTLSLVAICIAGLLGVFLIIDWMQQRNVRALAWWGSAYLIGASGMALASMPDPIITLPPVVPGALTFLACGMIWNGVRLFQGRRLLPLATFIGAAIWLGVGQIPGVLENGNGQVIGAMIVPVYTFFIAIELWRERRRTRYSRAAAIVVPCLHAGIFLVPLAMHAVLPEGHNAAWLTVFTLETIIYAVGTAFIVMLMVKDHHVHVYRTAACTDHLTGLLSRRAFMVAPSRQDAVSPWRWCCSILIISNLSMTALAMPSAMRCCVFLDAWCERVRVPTTLFPGSAARSL